MILSSSTLEKSDFLDVFVSKARWDCPTLVTLRTLMSTRLGTLAQNTVYADMNQSPSLGSLTNEVAEWSQRTSHLYVFPPNMVNLVVLKIINETCTNNERSYQLS